MSWESNDGALMAWLLNRMESHISSFVMFLSSTKEIWDFLAEMYSHSNYISQLFLVYEKYLIMREDDQTINDYYAKAKLKAY